MISSVRNAEVTSPPTIGAAMRFMTSAPEPVAHSSGTRPISIVATVISLGRTRCTVPSMCAAMMSSRSRICPARLAALEGVVDVDDHHDAGLGGQPDQGDDADPDRRRQPVVEQPQQPDAADQRERDRQQHDQHLDEVAGTAGNSSSTMITSVSGTRIFMRASICSSCSYWPVHFR